MKLKTKIIQGCINSEIKVEELEQKFNDYISCYKKEDIFQINFEALPETEGDFACGVYSIITWEDR